MLQKPYVYFKFESNRPIVKVFYQGFYFFYSILHTLQFNFGVRPLEKNALLRSALNVQLLTELYWYLNDVLMTPLRIASEQFSDIYPSIENQVELMTEMSDGAYPGVEKININAAKELEETFKDLRTE